jgi:hypothetical protein
MCDENSPEFHWDILRPEVDDEMTRFINELQKRKGYHDPKPDNYYENKLPVFPDDEPPDAL